MENRVSIAMTTYNGEKYLRQQLESLYSQSIIPDEIIVCDDRSSDNTVSILKEYSAKGLKYYVNDKQLGVNSNFFKAISLCNGDYIAICDQDDIWLPNKIERLLESIKKYEGDRMALVSSKKVDIDSNGNILSKKRIYKDQIDYPNTFLSTEATCQGCCLMFNRKLADYVLNKYYLYPFPFSYIIYDAFISFISAMVGIKVDIGEQLMFYRHHDKNVIGQRQGKKSLKERLAMQAKYRSFIPDSRFICIRRIFEIIKNDVQRPEIIALINKLKQIEDCHSPIFGLYYILKIRELSYWRKFKITVETCIVYCLKKIIKIS